MLSVAVLPLRTILLRFNGWFVLIPAPPLLFAPPLTVRPLRLTLRLPVPLSEMAKSPVWPPPLIVRLAAPGPVMVSVLPVTFWPL